MNFDELRNPLASESLLSRQTISVGYDAICPLLVVVSITDGYITNPTCDVPDDVRDREQVTTRPRLPGTSTTSTPSAAGKWIPIAFYFTVIDETHDIIEHK